MKKHNFTPLAHTVAQRLGMDARDPLTPDRLAAIIRVKNGATEVEGGVRDLLAVLEKKNSASQTTPPTNEVSS